MFFFVWLVSPHERDSAKFFCSVPQLPELNNHVKTADLAKSYLFQFLLHIHSNLSFIDTNLQICTHPPTHPPTHPRLTIAGSKRKNQHVVTKRELRPSHKPTNFASKLITSPRPQPPSAPPFSSARSA